MKVNAFLGKEMDLREARIGLIFHLFVDREEGDIIRSMKASSLFNFFAVLSFQERLFLLAPSIVHICGSLSLSFDR